MSVSDYNAETKQDRKDRRSRALARMEGKRGSELTDAEKLLLDTIRELGFDVQSHFMTNVRSGVTWHSKRAVVKAKPSWSHSIR